MMNNKRNVLVVFGGSSSEHEVSRVSAKSVIDNIDKNKCHRGMDFFVKMTMCCV